MERNEQGKLIVFEGPDGVGKTTLSKLAVDMLIADGQPTEWLSFPGREVGTLGHLIYEVHHWPEKLGVNSITSAAKQALHIAAHLDVIERQIRPLLDSGKHVVLDRFWWSTWVYGLNSGLNLDLLRSLIEVEKQGWGSCEPSHILLVKTEKPRDRADESIDRWLELVNGYQSLAEKESATFVVSIFNNDAPLSSAEQSLRRVLPLRA